jgi:hypothetical protein
MTSFRRRTAPVQVTPPDAGADNPGAPAEIPGPARPETPRTRAFMYVVENEARTRRTVRLVVAVTGAAAVLVCVLGVLAAVLGPTAFAVGGGGSVGGAAMAAIARKLTRPPPP